MLALSHPPKDVGQTDGSILAGGSDDLLILKNCAGVPTPPRRLTLRRPSAAPAGVAH